MRSIQPKIYCICYVKMVCLFLCSFLLKINITSSQNVKGNIITAAEAAKKIGEEVVIKAKVVTVFYAKNSTGKPTFLNLVYPFPNNPIAVIIFEEDMKRLKIDAQLYKGKNNISKRCGKIL